MAKSLKILHFNDTYNIEPDKKGAGGAAKFVQALNHYQEQCKNDGEFESLTLFSGDLLFPSTLSTMYEGQQMVLPFNRAMVDVACIGNHDLDYGIDKMMDVLNQTMEPAGRCQWIMSNLVEKDLPDAETGVGGLKRWAVVDRCGMKIGIIGIAEKEWVESLKDMEVELQYTNYKRTAQDLAQKLRSEHNCSLIIALSHMRHAHDVKLAAQCPGIDLVLGGHDHLYKIDGVVQDIKK